MRNPTRIRWLALVVTLLTMAACGKYNQLVEANATCDERWANLEAQMQRRYDLIPNLVATVKGQAAHEQETLTKVTEARSAATQIKLTSEDLSDPEKMAAFQKAQDQLKGSLSRLMVVQEQYPDLKANAAFHDLQVQLEGTENRILRAREEYNAAVKTYNAEQAKVGGSLVNKATGKPFKPRIYFTASAEAQGPAPTVKF
ncbi:MAG: LemA family protein [Deltaproteobacteria bacterium]|nr:LemA family protein [Deltaproteobacteria bacterium]